MILFGRLLFGPLPFAAFSRWCRVVTFLALSGLHAQEWTRFRGPDGSGIGLGPSIPLAFTAADFEFNIPLPGSGSSSPTLWGNRVFVTCSHDEEQTREVLCFNADTGERVWSWRTAFSPYRHNRQNSYAASTPAVDATRVYLTWISGERFIVLALGHDGTLAWRRDLGSFKARHGAGASPIVLAGTVLVTNDNAGGDSFLIGLDAKTGETRWRQARRTEVASYITPAVRRSAGGLIEVIFAGPPHGISGVDPLTGRVNWEVPGPFTQKSVASPVIADGLIFVAAGRGQGGVESAVVRPGEKARVVYEIKSDLPYVPTPIAIGEHLFILSDRGVLTCVVAATGKVPWREQLAGRYYASPVAVNGRIYCVSRAGEITVVDASPRYKLLGRSMLPEGTDATPAIANGRLYLRTPKRLVAVGGGNVP